LWACLSGVGLWWYGLVMSGLVLSGLVWSGLVLSVLELSGLVGSFGIWCLVWYRVVLCLPIFFFVTLFCTSVNVFATLERHSSSSRLILTPSIQKMIEWSGTATMYAVNISKVEDGDISDDR
jgi:hypothetical protein